MSGFQQRARWEELDVDGHKMGWYGLDCPVKGSCLVNTGITFRGPQNVGKFFSGRATSGSSRSPVHLVQ
jgi:hypothetical protein